MILSNVSRKVCLVLDKRYHMWQETKKTLPFEIEDFVVGDGSFANLSYNRIDDGWIPPLYKDTIQYDTWHNRSNAFDAWKSHRAIFLDCLRDYNFESLLLMEDDAIISDDFLDKCGVIEYLVENVNYDAIYLGYYPTGSETTWHNSDRIKVMNGGGGFHGVILPKHTIANLVTYKPFGPYDWLMKGYHSLGRCLGFSPNLIRQRSGFSYVEGHHLQKDDTL